MLVGRASLPGSRALLENRAEALERDGDGTVLTLVHPGLAGDARDAHAEGGPTYLARLVPVAAGRPAQPDPWIVEERQLRARMRLLRALCSTSASPSSSSTGGTYMPKRPR